MARIQGFNARFIHIYQVCACLCLRLYMAYVYNICHIYPVHNEIIIMLELKLEKVILEYFIKIIFLRNTVA